MTSVAANVVKSTGRNECYIYIDNSNLWIEGQKLAAAKQKLEVQHDPRFRIDIGKLVKKILGDRHQAFAKLYGSEPPAQDSVWAAIRKMEIVVQVYQRSFQGEEKEVDTSLTADAVEMACEKSGGGGVFVIIAGDRDYIPCINVIMKKKFDIEIYAWKQGLANSLVDMARRNNKSLKIHHLESLMYQPNESPWVYYCLLWNEKVKQVPYDRSIVHCFSRRDDCDVKKLVKAATDFFKLPCQGCWLGDKKADAVVVIVPPEWNETNATVVYDFTQLFNNWKMSTAVKLFRCHNMVTAAKYFAPTMDNVYAVEGREETEDDFNGFNVVPSSKTKTKKMISSEPCQYNFACNKVGRCGWKHTDDELRYFRKHERLGRGYKSKPCTRQYCKFYKDTVLCDYAHDVVEARCYYCNRVGVHFAYDCKEGRD